MTEEKKPMDVFWIVLLWMISLAIGFLVLVKLKIFFFK